MNSTDAIDARGLAKSFDSKLVLDGIDLTVAQGGVFALLGPNGAGKTTTIRILATLTRADGGSARVAGHDVLTEPGEVRRRISLTGQYAALDELQSGAENLEMIARLRGLSGRAARARGRELLALFDLEQAAARRVAAYSGGMRRRLDLAASLIGDPQLIFLDEPTTGLDPRSRQTTWDLIATLAAAGVTVLLTTQHLEEADRLAGRIALLDRGRIVAAGSAEELKRGVGAGRLELWLLDAASFDCVLARAGARAVDSDRTSLRIGLETDGGAAQVRSLLDELDADCSRIARFALRRASLEDVFMSLTGRGTEASEREVARV